MKKMIIFSLCALILPIGIFVSAVFGHVKTSGSSGSAPPPQILEVRVTHDEDMCSIEDPCFARVVARDSDGNIIGYTDYDDGPGTYYVSIPGDFDGLVCICVEPVPNPNCNCCFDCIPACEEGPPYPVFEITLSQKHC